MERDHLSAAIGGHLLDPTLLSFGEPAGKVLIALSKVGGVRSLHLRQLVCDPLSHRPAIIGIEPEVRIAHRVHIPHGAADATSGLLENIGEL